jgi:hypothetical protein
MCENMDYMDYRVSVISFGFSLDINFDPLVSAKKCSVNNRLKLGTGLKFQFLRESIFRDGANPYMDEAIGRNLFCTHICNIRLA